MGAPLMPAPEVPGGEAPANPAQEAWEDLHGEGTTADTFVPGMVTDPYDTDNDGYPNAAGDVTPTGGPQYGWSEQQAKANMGTPIKNWPTKWKVEFNPPAIGYATGERLLRGARGAEPVLTETSSSRYRGKKPSTVTRSLGITGRDLLLDPGGRYHRTQRKGWFVPDTTVSAEFLAEGVAEDGKTPLVPDKSVLDISVKQPILYGFRFMYNPSEINFSAAVSSEINPGLMASGGDKFNPIGLTATGSTISLSFPLTRVDDMQAILTNQPTYPSPAGLGNILEPPGVNYAIDANAVNLYARKGYKQVDVNDLREIATRGTGYDLEYLYRALVGRKWNTPFRGATGDMGILWSFPLKLYLSNKMIYRVRCTSVGYTHRSFTSDMVPLHTLVSMTFDRIPDGTVVAK